MTGRNVSNKSRKSTQTQGFGSDWKDARSNYEEERQQLHGLTHISLKSRLGAVGIFGAFAHWRITKAALKV